MIDVFEFCSLETLKKLDDTRKKYLETFGENSLDRVILYEPFPTEKEAIKEMKILMRAMKKGVPLKQVSEEIWKNIIF